MSIQSDKNNSMGEGFVRLHQIDPNIIVSARYASVENFVGSIIDGYISPNLALTREAAHALQQAQNHFQKDGYNIVVYDAYRPQRAVSQFMKWAQDLNDQKMKEQYYPRVDKSQVFELGYLAKRSGHSRGSTVDLTLIHNNQKLHKIKCVPRQLKDGFNISFLDDGTLDMGASFDLFDKASHHGSDLISMEAQRLRIYLKETMERCGFTSYSKEWWHYSLSPESFPDTYFDFLVE